MELLRKLDRDVTKPGTIWSIAVAYPIYQKLTKKQREKLVPQILALTEELSK